MKKNYFFGKAIAGMAILFSVSWGLVSCGKGDNALEEIINSETPITAEVISKTDDGATIKVYVPSDISKLLSEDLKADLATAALNGETYTVTIDASGLTVNSSDNTITIPKIAGSDIVLQFENDFSANVPLVIKASSASDEPVAAINEMTIETPDGATGIELDIQMPETTVTITGGAVIENLVSFTAINTLVIENGVTVKFLQVKGGRVEVKEGGVIETYVLSVNEDFEQLLHSEYNNEANEGGIVVETFRLDENGEKIWNDDLHGPGEGGYETDLIVYSKEGENDLKPYFIKNLKVIKGDAAAEINNFWAADGDGKPAVEKLTIAEGASVNLGWYQNIQFIEGEGSTPAKLNLQGAVSAKTIKNLEIIPFDGQENYQIASDAEDCIFNGNEIGIGGYAGVFTFKNCTFKNDEGFIIFVVDAQDDNYTSLTETFESCTFSGTSKFRMNEYRNSRYVEGEENPEIIPYNNFVAKYIFKDCKHGSNNITETYTDILNYNTETPWDQGETYAKPNGVSVLFNFGAGDYRLKNLYEDEQTDANKKWSFVEAND
jgi:hypothetical protein